MGASGPSRLASLAGLAAAAALSAAACSSFGTGKAPTHEGDGGTTSADGGSGDGGSEVADGGPGDELIDRPACAGGDLDSLADVTYAQELPGSPWSVDVSTSSQLGWSSDGVGAGGALSAHASLLNDGSSLSAHARQLLFFSQRARWIHARFAVELGRPPEGLYAEAGVTVELHDGERRSRFFVATGENDDIEAIGVFDDGTKIETDEESLAPMPQTPTWFEVTILVELSAENEPAARFALRTPGGSDPRRARVEAPSNFGLVPTGGHLAVGVDHAGNVDAEQGASYGVRVDDVRVWRCR